jgi:hypothetical protein
VSSPVDYVATAEYTYLLGLYLGDGCISAHTRSFSLRIYLDGVYPGIIDACQRAVQAVVPGRRVTIQPLPSRAVQVTSYYRHWVCFFPQHGPGRKHERPIRLEPWQRAGVERHPLELLRGLIHSDGCRSVNRVRTASATYQYARYFFRNASEDILGIFAETCDALGVAWTRSAARTISVSKRSSVARLDAWIGPKA